jgi:hypothetical protein
VVGILLSVAPSPFVLHRMLIRAGDDPPQYKMTSHVVRTALPRVHAGMSTPANDADKTDNDVRRIQEVIEQGAEQDHELPTETKPAGPLPDFNT